jgi:succinate-semialdehyde dehydrogenase/glutarate-semialdehyde dehydrogenase
MYHQPALLIDGVWRGANSGRRLPVINPANEELLGEAPAADAADVALAIAAAEAGFRGWRQTHGWERGKVLRSIARRMGERRDELAKALSLEIGRPLSQSAAEVQIALEQFDWFAGEAERLFGETIASRQGGQLLVTPEPVGIVAAFTAWNFPINLLARKIAPALAAGCAILCRPSEQAPATATILLECCVEGGAPAGVVQLLLGKADEIVPAIMASPAVRKISLTGSTAVGKRLLAAAAETVKRCSMELGGHSPVVVCEDVDAEAVGRLCAQFKFRNAGQVCISPSRFYVHEGVVERFTSAFVGFARELALGDPLEQATTMGPLTTRRQLERIEALSRDTEASGARLLCGGRRPADRNKGYFFEPTVFAEVPEDARLMREEPFGPLAPINAFRDLGAAIQRANDTEYALAAYAFTGSLEKAQRLSRELHSGMVGLNSFAIAHAEAPFGGMDYSGMGREGGRQAIGDYQNVKLSHFVAA